MQAATQVAVTVDPSNTVKAFGKAFSGRAITIQELLQNARRAGATRVDLTWDVDSKTLTVEDDGSGITDFSALLGVAKSGWDEGVIDRESPYGVGFLGALFNARRVRVESNNACLDAQTEHLLAMRPVALGRSERSHGTRVELHETTIPGDSLTHEDLSRRCIGFPIEVTLNGQRIERPHADGAGDAAWYQTPVGEVRLDIDSLRIVAYLQGFRIWSNGIPGGKESVVHLDPRQFFGRLPDRDCLIEHQAQGKRIEEVVRELAGSVLEEYRRTMQSHAFCQRFWDACVMWQASSLLNNEPFFPAGWIAEHDGEPRIARYYGDGQWRPRESRLLPRDELASLLLVSADPTPAESAYLLAHGARLVQSIGKLDADHWINTMVRRLSSHGDRDEVEESAHQSDPAAPLTRDSVTITPKGYRGSTTCEVDGCDVEIRVCEAIVLDGPLGEVTLPKGLGCGVGEVHMDDDDVLIYATPDTWSSVVRQVSSHTDPDSDTVDENAQSNSEGEFARALASFCGACPSDVIKMLFNDRISYWDIPESCRGKAFRIDVDETGRFSVSLL